VEDVYTVPSARGRGLGRALVTRGVEIATEAGHELTFIIADEDDWPRQLYEQIGFEPIGRIIHFHRELTVSQPAEAPRSPSSVRASAGAGDTFEQLRDARTRDDALGQTRRHL